MGKLIIIPLAMLATACALPAKDINEGIEECEKYGLVPIVVVKQDYVRRVECFPPEDAGYILLDKGRELPKLLPTLRPRD